MRLNVTVPDELWREAKRRSPTLNVSGVLQAGLQQLLSCEHTTAVCEVCAAPIDLDELRERSRRDLAWAVWLRVCDHVLEGGTGEGTARVMLDELRRHRVPDVERWVLPRLSRSRRNRAAELEAARARHPSTTIVSPEERVLSVADVAS